MSIERGSGRVGERENTPEAALAVATAAPKASVAGTEAAASPRSPAALLARSSGRTRRVFALHDSARRIRSLLR